MKTYPLLQSQLGIFLEWIKNPSVTQYNLPLLVEFDKTIDSERLELSLQKLFTVRIEMRTRFVMIDGEPRQYSDEQMQLTIPRLQMEQAEVKHYVTHNLIKPYDLLSGEPLWRFTIIESPEKTYLFAEVHHTVGDGLTLAPNLINDFSKIYEGGLPVELSFGMYEQAEAEQQTFHAEPYNRAVAYYKEKFEGVEFVTLSDNNSSLHLGQMIRQSSFLPVAEVDTWCKEHETTSNLLFMAAFSFVIAQLSRQTDIAYYTINHGRMDKRLLHGYGMFVKSVPVMASIEGKQPILDFIKGFRSSLMSTIRYGVYPFNHFCRDLHVVPRVSFGFQGAGMQEFCEIAGKRYNAIQLPKGKIDDDLSCVIYIREGQYDIRLESSDVLNSSERLKQVANAIKACVQNMMAHPEAILSELSMVSEEEKQQLMELSQGEVMEYDSNQTYIGLFKQQARITPASIAVVDKEGKLTYEELDKKSDLLASSLLKLGVTQNSFVCIMLDYQKEFLVAALAVQKAGGAYVPLDYEYPNDRLLFMLEDSESQVLITTHKVFDEKRAGGDSFSANNILFIDDYNFAVHDSLAAINNATPTGLAYMIYTSGSTGKPKGVMISHYAKLNFVHFITKRWGLSAQSRICCHSNFSFDASIEDLYPVLSVGGTLHILSAELRKDLPELYNYICQYGITGGCYTTQHGVLLASTYDLPLDYICLGGEKLSANPDTKARVYNTYGPTEFTVDSTYFELEPGKEYKNIPIGRPLYNLSAYVVNESGLLLPRGAAGELCMAGPQIANGYWKREELTAEKFIDCSFAPQTKMYRTGDLVCWNEEGELEYLGRIDNQVKLRGFRIELGEIESRTYQYEGIGMVSVQVKEIGSVQHLCCYFTANREVDTNDLQEFLSKDLTEYMVPTAYIQLDEMPLTPNGKVNTKALPLPKIKNAIQYVALESVMEKQIAEAFGVVLGYTEPIGALDSFFSLGGDSIKSIHLVSVLRKMNIQLSVPQIMKLKNVRALAAEATEVGELTIDQKAWSGDVPGSAITNFFFSQLLPVPAHYNQAVMLRSAERIDRKVLEMALSSIVEHHDMLRAVVKENKRLYVHEADAKIEFFTITEFDETASIEFQANKLQRSIDLKKGPMLKGAIFHTPNYDALLLACHHLVVDGVSWRIILEDLNTAYLQAKESNKIILPQKTHSYRTYAEAIQRYRDSYLLSEELEYWKSVQQKMRTLSLSDGKDYNRQRKSLKYKLDAATTAHLINNSSKAYNTEINDLLITALGRSYYYHTNNSSLAIQLEGHGSESINEPLITDRTVGWFTSIFPIVIDHITGDIRRDIRETKEMLHKVPNKGLGYGILQYIESAKEEQGIDSDLTPLIGFNYLGEFSDSKEGNVFFFMDSNLPTGQLISDSNFQGPGFNLGCMVVGGELVIYVTFDVTTYSEVQAGQLTEGFISQLKQIVEHISSKQSVECTASDLGCIVWSDFEFQSIYRAFAERQETIERIYPLTSMQQGMLLKYQMEPDSTAYNSVLACSIDQLPTEAQLIQILDLLAKKHEVLRTSIIYCGVNEAQQAIVSRQLPLKMIDISSLYNQKEALDAIYAKEMKHRFDLQNDSLFRITCVKTSENSCQLLFMMYHIIIDGWSLQLCVTDFMEYLSNLLYNKVQLIPDAICGRYEAYIRHQTQQDKKKGLSYWRNLLNGYGVKTVISSQGTIDEADRASSNSIMTEITGKELGALQRLCADEQVTMNTVIELAWGIILQAYNRTEDALFVKVTSGRSSDKNNIQDILGLFINSVPVRVTTQKGMSVREALQTVQTQAAETSQYDYCGLSEIQQQTPLGSELYQSILTFQNYISEEKENNFLNFKVEYAKEDTINDISVVVFLGKNLGIQLLFDTNLYSETDMQRLLSAFKNTVLSIAPNLHGEIQKLNMLGEAEETELLKLAQGRIMEYDNSETMVDLLVKQARNTPDSIAVVFEERSFTYREVDELTTRLALYLQSIGVTNETAVGVMIERSELMLIYPMAIMKAGGAYMPLDFHFPEDRLMFMLADANVNIVLSEGSLLKNTLPEFAGQAFLSDELENLPSATTEPFHSKACADGLAVILFTSGSTGQPKGVMLEHRGIVNFAYWYASEFSMTSQDRSVGYANFGFDAHMIDIYPTLLVGGRVYIISSSMRMDLVALNEYMNANQLSIAFFTTQIGYQISNVLENRSLRLMSLGGEKLQPCKQPPYRFYNVYGPTECSLYSTFYNIEGEFDGTQSYIGLPLANYRLYVLDNNHQLVPRGVAGELVIAGAGVARGYLNRPELTAEKFITVRGEKAYRSGDLVRWTENGNVEFLGRIDNQIKLRGLRIELDEIESQINRYPDITSCIVDVKEIGAVQHLCCYFTADSAIDPDQLKENLAKNLTDYMVPTAYMQLEKMPLNPNGKINRKELPTPEVKLDEIIAPATDRERELFNVIASVLKNDKFGVTNNLISLGLTSLTAMRLSTYIQQQLGLHIPTKVIMKNPTVRQLALLGSENSEEKEKGYDLRDFYPLTENQRGIYIDWEQSRDALQYNVPLAFCFKDVNIYALAEALEKVIAAHPYLKTRLGYQGDVVVQLRLDSEPTSVLLKTLEQEPDKAFLQSRVRPFDLFNEPLYRIELYKYQSAVYLFMDIHHIIYDGVSSSIFLQQLSEAYVGETIAAETYTAFDRAIDEEMIFASERYAEAEQYFDQLLTHVTSVEYPHSMILSGNHKNQQIIMEGIADKSAVDRFCSESQVTANSFFLTILTQVLHRITREDGVMITSISNGREESRMQGIMGMFVKTLPITSKVGQRTLADATREMHNQLLETLSRDFYPFTHLVQRHRVKPQILFSYQGGLFDDVEMIKGGADTIVLDNDTAKVPLIVTIYPNDKGTTYTLLLEYNDSLYSAPDMQQLAQAMNTLIGAGIVDSNLQINQLPLVAEAEKQELVQLGQGCIIQYDQRQTLVDIFTNQTEKSPDATVIVFRDRSYTYREVDEITTRLAIHLQSLGVSRETSVGVMIDRSEYMLIYPMAIMKAGGAYMPLDSHYPTDRLMFMCEDANVRLILSEDNLVSETMPEFQGTVFLRSQMHALPPLPVEPFVCTTKPNDLLVLLYTSGSSGQPKGVMLEHQGMVNYCYWYVSEFDMTATDRSVAYANFGFDAHIIDIYPTLLAGGAVYILPSDMRMDLVAMNDYIEQNHLSIAFLTTQIGCQMATLFDNKSLRVLSAGGEKMPPIQKPSYRFYNGYGPTECSLFSTFYNIEGYFDGVRSIIGRPLANYKLFVVDKNQQILPRGMAGELLITGVGVARGYINRPDLTEEKFLTFEGEPTYRSGDLVRWTEEGDIEFLGRIDNQVKLRGLRIELGEIEVLVAKYETIRQVVVDVKEISGVQHLCCYFVADSAIDEGGLNSYLGETLTEFMVPTSYMQLEQLPLNPNGKVDRKALPLPEIKNTAVYVAPATKIEQKIAALFASVLNRKEPVGALDSFFALGGDSIKSIRLASLLRQDGILLQVSQIMKLKNVRAMAEAADLSSNMIEICQDEWSGALPNSAIVSYFFDLHLPKPHHLNQSTMLRASERVNMQWIESALAALVAHHDILRSVVTGNQLVVRPISAGQLFDLEKYDLTSEAQLDSAMETIANQCQSGFNLAHGPLLKVILFHTPCYDALLLICHHLVVDGVSWRIMVEDLSTAYRQLSKGECISLPQKTHSYKEYCDALCRYRTSFELSLERNYWQEVQKKVKHLPLSAGTNYGRKFDYKINSLDSFITSELLGAASLAYHTEINDLLLTAFGRSYQRFTGSTSLSIQLEGHGREPFAEPLFIDRTVGWFTSIYPVVLEGLGGDIRHDIRVVKEIMRRIPNKGFGYAQLMGIDTDFVPLFGFNYLGELKEGGGEAADFSMEMNLPEGVPVASQNVFGPSFSINCLIQDGQLVTTYTYDNDTFNDEEATALSEGFVEELYRIVKHTTACKMSENTASDLGETAWRDEEFLAVCERFKRKGEPLQRIYPLTPMQEGMLFKYMAEPESTAYRILSRFGLNFLPTEAQLRYALDRLAAKHEVLRTAIVFRGVNDYRQAITERKLGLDMIDITTQDNQEAALTEIHQKEVMRGFDLEDDSLLRIVCIKTSDKTCKLLFVMHHIILDGWCLPIFMPDFQKFLMEVVQGEEQQFTCENSGRYESFIRRLHRKDKFTGLNYWRTLLADYQTKAVIPFFGVIPVEQRSDLENLVIDIDPAVVKTLSVVCSDLQVTLNTAVELAWGLVLQAYNRSDDAVYVKVVSGRNDVVDNLQDIVGLFINSVPVRITTTPEMTVREALLAVQMQAAESNAYDFCPLVEIQQQTDLGIDLFQSIIAFENFPDVGEETDSNFVVESGSEEVFNEIGLTAYVGDTDQLSLHIRFDNSLYSKQDIERILSTFATLIKGIAFQTNDKVQFLPLIPDHEMPVMMDLSKGKDMPFDISKTFAQVFTARATMVPDAVAVVDKESQFTYRELDRRSNIMAMRLLEMGVQPNTFICVMLDRKKEFVLSVLSIHKAGCGYTPLDFEYPNARLLYMLENSESKVLITSRDVLEEKRKDGDFVVDNIFFVEDVDFNVEVTPIDYSTPEGMAYMIYTSGSTGNPKGAMIHQSALMNFIHVVIDMENLTAHDRISGHRSFSFDAHIEDMYPVLTLGGSFHIMPSEIRKDLSAIYDFIVEHRITGGGYSTAIGALLLNTFDLPVRFITAGGEKLDGVKSDHIEIINVYGPTECTVDTNYFKLEIGQDYKNIPIGRPVANNWCFIVSPQGQLLPRGVAGELCFAGIQVGRGYWNLPERTASVFVDCPFLPLNASDMPVRMYHTGDLCRWNEDGDIEYLTRVDNQVKLRGFRIELGEIESEAGRFNGMLQIVAELKEVGGSQHLCLYYTVAEGCTVDKEELHNYLIDSPLAEYMVPDIYMELPKMPLTPNAKINRKALPEPSFEADTKKEEPATIKEQVLYGIVCELLHRQDFGVTANLLKLGMTSLLAIKTVVLAEKQGILLKVNDVLKKKNIRALLDGNQAICYWANTFSADKPVVVLVYGMTPYNLLVPLANKLSQCYSVICLETILDHYKYIFKDADLVEVVEMYYALINYHLTSKCKIHAFVGHCFGGEISYRLAVRWQKDTELAAPVFMYDTYWTGIVYNMSKSILLNIPAHIREKYAKEINKGLEQNHIGASLMCTEEMPKYPGRVIYHKALQDFPLPFEKELSEEMGTDFVYEQKAQMGIYQLDPVKFWKEVNPQMEYYAIDGDHFTMMDECFVSDYVAHMDNKL